MTHVTVSDTTPRATYTPSTGTTGPFAVNFTVFDPSTDLTVYVGGSLAAYNASPSTKLQYSWSGTLIDGGYNSGTITLGAACDDDEEIVIERTVAIARTTDFTYPSSTLNIQALNTQLDQVFAIIQQTSSKLDNRTLRQPTADLADLSDLPVKASRASKLLGFDSDGDVTVFANEATSDLLAAIADLGTTGMLALTSTTAAAVRTITGTSNEITVTNGNGVSGNPTLSLPSTIDLTGKTVNLAAGVVDAITEIASGLKTGADTKLVTGTAGTNGNLAAWNGDGDLVDAGAALSAYATLAVLASTSNGDGAALIGIEDSGGLITATTVEGALAENRAAIDAIEADYLTSTDIANMLETSDIGSTVQAYDADTTKNDVANTFTADQEISVSGNHPTWKWNRTDTPAGTGQRFSNISNWCDNNAGSNAEYTRLESIQTGIAAGGSEAGEFRFHTRQANAVAERARVGAGIYHPSATGTDKGNNTINFGAVYDDNSLLTDHVFDLYVDGKQAPTDSERIKAWADEFEANRTWVYDLDKYAAHWKSERHLPAMPSRENYVQNGLSSGELINRLWETVETQAIHIEQINERLKKVER